MPFISSPRQVRPSLLVVVICFYLCGFSFQSIAAEKATIDLLVLYTESTANRYGGDPSTRFNHLINVANQTYIDSGVNLELRITHTEEVEYSDEMSTETALRDITYGENVFSNVEALREQHKADMVILFRPYNSNQGGCGLAWVGGDGSKGDMGRNNDKRYAYSQIAVSTCPDYTLVHELGHNLGLRHSRESDTVGGTFPYALGHGEHGNFSTIMAYQATFGVDYWTGKTYKFSNPEKLCKGSPCGVNRELSNGADAAYTLNITGTQVAEFYRSNAGSSFDDDALATASGQMEEAEKAFIKAKMELALQTKSYAKLADKKDKTKTELSNYTKFGKFVFIKYLHTIKKQSELEKSRQNLIEDFMATFVAYKNTSGQTQKKHYHRLVGLFGDYADVMNKLQITEDNSIKLRSAVIALMTKIKSVNEVYDRIKEELDLAKEKLEHRSEEYHQAENNYAFTKNAYQAMIL